MRLVLLFIVVTSLCIGGLPGSADAQPSDRNLDIYLLIGQSNMGGRADIPAEDAGVIPGVWVLRGQDDWVEGKNPINVYSSIQGGALNKMNPGYTFSTTMRRLIPDRQIGLVSNARGATGLAQWMPGTTYYNEAVKRARWAMEYGTIKGVLWHQGEQDSKDPANIPIYLENIKIMINALREDLGDPTLPFIAGQLTMERPSYQAFNEMILDFPGILPNTDLVSSDGLDTRDGVHFNTRSMKILGERYADKMYPLLTSAPVPCSLVPYANLNNEGWSRTSTADTDEGGQVQFGPQSSRFGADQTEGWSWSGPNGFTASQREITLENIQANQAGTYTVTNTDPNGCGASANFTLTVNGTGASLVGTYYLKNVATGRYLDANPGGEVVHNAASGGQDTQWNLNESTPGYYFIDNAMPDRGPLAAKPALNSAIIYLAERYNNSAYQNREWQAVPVGGNVYKLLCKDNARGYLTASGSREVINAADGDGDVAHWELISVGASQRTADTPSKVVVFKDAEPTVYPNPVAGTPFVLDFNGSTASEVSVHTITGRQVYHRWVDDRKMPSSLTIAAPLKSGIYIVTTVDLQGQPSTTKLVVE